MYCLLINEYTFSYLYIILFGTAKAFFINAISFLFKNEGIKSKLTNAQILIYTKGN